MYKKHYEILCKIPVFFFAFVDINFRYFFGGDDVVISHNLQALNSLGKLNTNTISLAKATERLSSGYRVNSSADDAAGLAVSEKLKAQIRGIAQAVRNCKDGINLVQTFEGALGQQQEMIKRAKELATEAANGTYDDEVDRAAIQLEYENLCEEINQIADTDFNGVVMLNGGNMADGITILTENGTMWRSPSKVEFRENTFRNNFYILKEALNNVADPELTIELLPDVKDKILSDEELMGALLAINKATLRASYDHVAPKFTLEGLPQKYQDMVSIEPQDDGSAIIKITTPKSGTVDAFYVHCTELPHYASSTAKGLWVSGSTADSRLGALDPTDPNNAPYLKDGTLERWTDSYVRSGRATRQEREEYLQWIKDTKARADLVKDENFDRDTDPLKYTWSVDGKTYENYYNSSGTPQSNGDKLPLYPDGYTGGPQVYVEDMHFYYNDEQMNSGADCYEEWSYSVSSWSASCSYKGKSYVGAGTYYNSESASNKFFLDVWLDYGSTPNGTTMTLTYDKDTDMWLDNVTNQWHSADYYGIDYRYYNYSEETLKKPENSYERQQDAKNLYHLFEADGKLPDGFTLSVSLSTPASRTDPSGGKYFRQNSTHYDNYNGTPRSGDFKMGEFDPENPDAGGIDYKVANDGAVYRYDEAKKSWTDADGNVVDLEAEGVHLPKDLAYDVDPLHDGMEITVSNPTQVGGIYIEADLQLYKDPGVNAYFRLYDNLTYTDNLILQTNSRSRDAVMFTFHYSATSLGGLKNDLDCSANGLGMDVLRLDTIEEANLAIDCLDFALSKTSMVRGVFGAIQNRLEYKIDNLTNIHDNINSAESHIRDADMAEEMMNYTKSSILQSVAQAMLSQASQQPQGVLSLLSANANG